jgi:hypothetical protein
LQELSSLRQDVVVQLVEVVVIGGLLVVPVGIFAAGFLLGRRTRRPDA